MERDFRNWDWDLIGSTLQVLPLGFMKNVEKWLINYCGYYFFLVLLSVEGLKLTITLHS